MAAAARGPADISITARYTAAAWEHLGLPHAGRFADPLGRWMLKASLLRSRLRPHKFSMLADVLTPRHLYMDEWLRKNGVRQVVEIAAGYSPRGLMFAQEGLRYVEVDRPAVIAEKQRRCGALTTQLHFVSADALDDDLAPRVLAHCTRDLGTAIVSEGLSPYFSRGDYLSLLANLRRLAQPLSATLLTDFYLAPPQLSGNAARLGLAQIGMRLIADRFHVYLRDESGIAALFAEAGWNVSSIARPARDQHYRRGPVPLRRDLLCIVEARPA